MAGKTERSPWHGERRRTGGGQLGGAGVRRGGVTSLGRVRGGVTSLGCLRHGDELHASSARCRNDGPAAAAAAAVGGNVCGPDRPAAAAVVVAAAAALLLLLLLDDFDAVASGATKSSPSRFANVALAVS